MIQTDQDPQTLARIVGLSLLAPIVVGLAAIPLLASGIDINLSADVIATAQNMLEAETSLRAKAYLALLTFVFAVLFAVGLFLLLQTSGRMIAAWAMGVSLSAAFLSLLGAVFGMNAAHIAGNPAYADLASEEQRLLLAGIQATSDYTSFHLSLVLTSLANAAFFYLFWRSQLIPRLISGWGVFASLFVASAIVIRDFVPVVGHFGVTASFMLSNLVALVALGLYLAIKGVRTGRA